MKFNCFLCTTILTLKCIPPRLLWNDVEAVLTVLQKGMLIRQLWEVRRLIFCLQTFDISVELTLNQPPPTTTTTTPPVCLSVPLSVSIRTSLRTILRSMPIRFNASLQALLSVSRGHDQSWWMFQTTNVSRIVFMLVNSGENEKIFFPYLCLCIIFLSIASFQWAGRTFHFHY